MSRFQKMIRKYERQLLLGLVIFLLVIFSVGGALKCSGGGGSTVDYGGSFRPGPGRETTDVPSAEFLAWQARFGRFQANMSWPTLRFLPFVWQTRSALPMHDLWSHIVETTAAADAGYRVGTAYELPTAVQEAVERRMEGLQFTDALYDRFLREYFRGTAKDFEQTVKEVLRRDAFLRPIVESQRYGIPYAEAYDRWKVAAERVDLRFVALPGEAFALVVRQEEVTRRSISRQLDLLQGVTDTTRRINLLIAQAKAWSAEHEGAWPESLTEIPGPFGDKAPQDAWEHDLVYEVRDGQPWVASVGPDGEAGTADDVTPDTLAQVRTLAALREVGDAVLQWHGAAGSWPADLAALRGRPTETTLPPLKREVKDGWDRELVYSIEGQGEASMPRLASAGPDGVAGNEDDVPAQIDENRALVEPPLALTAFVLADVEDAWGQSLRVQLKDAATWRWEVASAGADREWGTPDDLTTGNRQEIEAFFARPEVRGDYQLPLRRRFRALWVRLPLVPDEMLRKMWAAFPEQHPEEKEAFERWRLYHPEPYYQAEDPADPEHGHGAAYVRERAPDAQATLVPDASIFGDAPTDLYPADDPLHDEFASYVEKGWRPILLREEFVERVLNELLGEVRASQEAHAAWAKRRDEGAEDLGPEPVVVTFEALLDRLVDYLPGTADPPWIGFYETPEPLTREAWEAVTPGKPVDGLNLTLALQPLVEPDALGAIPTNLHDVQTKVILQNVEFLPSRPQELSEVADQVFERFLAKRRLDRAQAELEKLRRDAERAASSHEGGEEGGDEPPKTFEEVLAAWGEALGVPYFDESTGTYIGSRPPMQRTLPDDLPEAERARLARRDYVRLTGYETVRASASLQDTVEAAPGTFGRRILRDEREEGTDAAYLVRVLSRSYPPPAAFSPREYSDFLTTELFGDLVSASQGGARRLLRDMQGVIPQALARWYDDFDWVRARFDVKTRSDVNVIPR